MPLECATGTMTVAVQADFLKIILAIRILDLYRHDPTSLSSETGPEYTVYSARQAPRPTHRGKKQNKPKRQYKRLAFLAKPPHRGRLVQVHYHAQSSPCIALSPIPQNAASCYDAPTQNLEAPHPHILATEEKYLGPEKPLAMTAWISILVDGPSCGLQNFKSMNRPLTGGSNVMLHLFLSLSM